MKVEIKIELEKEDVLSLIQAWYEMTKLRTQAQT